MPWGATLSDVTFPEVKVQGWKTAAPASPATQATGWTGVQTVIASGNGIGSGATLLRLKASFYITNALGSGSAVAEA